MKVLKCVWRMRRSMAAYLLAFAMLCSLVVVPVRVQAIADVELEIGVIPAVATEDVENNSSNADITIHNSSEYNSLKAMVDAGYQALQVTLTIGSYTAWDGKDAGIMPYVSTGNTGWSNGDVWKNVTAAGTYTVELPLSAVGATDSSEIARFGVQVANITGDVSISDVSAKLVTEATGGSGGSTGGGTSSSAVDDSTDTSMDVEFNYAKLLQQSLYFYDANMCGTNEGVCGVKWRGNCHTYDANQSVDINGKTYTVDASGGFHDAGDHPKFGQPQGYAASVLGTSYYLFEDGYDKAGQKKHLQTITDYFCEYFRRCTIYDSTKKVVGFVYQVGDGNSDHAYWGAPEKQTTARPLFVASADNPATDEVCVAIAALAINYINFSNAKDLQVAEDLYAFMDGISAKAVATEGANGFYTRYGSWEADYALASAALYKATENETYKNNYNDKSGSINQYWVMDWDNTGIMGAMLMGDTAKVKSVADESKSGTVLDGVYVCRSKWGSCRYNTAGQFVGLAYDKMTKTATYDAWAVSQMNYIIGDNPNKRCYAVGYNANSSKYPHHRAASNSGDANSVSDNHYTLLGALVGGPKQDGTYKDDQGDYEMNEVALDYNAAYVGSLAALVSSHYGEKSTKLSYAKTTSDNVSWKLMSEAELKAVGMTKFYGTSGSSDTTEDETTESKTTEDKTTESKTTEDKTTESKTTEDKTTESKTTEDKTTESKTTEDKTTESKTTEDKTTEDKTTESKTTEDKTTESKTTEDKTTESKTTEDKTTEEKTTEETGDKKTTIDLSKITSVDCDYVKKLSAETADGTKMFDISKEGDKLVIKTGGESYQFTGKNPNVKLVADKGGSITLQDAEILSLDVADKTKLTVKGNCTIAGGITGTGSLTVNGGSLKVVQESSGSDGICVGSFSVNSGTLSVEVKDGAGIVAKDIDLSGGKVTVCSSDAALSGDNIKISGSDVALTVTEQDASAISAKDTVSLESGAITVKRPSGSTAVDIKTADAGKIVVGSNMSVPNELAYSKTPVDESGTEITEPSLLDVGATFVDSQNIYKVVKKGTLDNSKYGTVAYAGRGSEDGTVVIPDTVTYRKVTYSVVKLSAGAFAGDKNLKKITLGANIVKIPSKAFSGCEKLSKVTMKGKVTSIGANAFKNCNSKLKLVTPKKKGYTYRWYVKSSPAKEVAKPGFGKYGNKALTGKLAPNLYTVKFNGNGAGGKMPVMKNCKYGKSYKLSANKFIRDGFQFAGWSTKKNGGGKTYADRTKIKNLSSKHGAVVTLYAQWKKQ